METTPRELIDLAWNWARAGHTRDGAPLASMSRPPAPDAHLPLSLGRPVIDSVYRWRRPPPRTTG